MNGISLNELSKLCSAPQRARTAYTSKVRMYWCPFAKSRGKCDQQCAANPFCAKVLSYALADKDGTNVPIGLLIWRLRNHKARIQEELSKAEKEPIERNLLGEVISGDAFVRLEATIGD